MFACEPRESLVNRTCSSRAARICPKCHEGVPAQYGSTFHCNQCGHKWKDIRRWRQDPGIPRCTLDGELLVWDEGRGLWVDVVNGATHEPAREEN